MVDVKEYKLDDTVEFIGYDSEEDWHKLRQKGIGGSDTGAIMGLNKYTSPLKLYRTKMGMYAEDDSDNVYIKKGKDLEGLIFEKYVKPDFDLDVYKIIHPEHIFVNKQYPWLRANCDGLAVCQNESAMLLQKHIVIEIKWVSEWAEVNWDGDDYCGIPASYYAQVQHYMTVTGARVAYLYAMFDRDWTVKKYVIPHNASFCIKMLSQTRKFYANMQAGIEPKITATLDKCFMPSALEDMPKKTIETEEMNDIISEYLSIKEDIKNLEKQANELYDKAVQRYLDGERPTSLFKMNISACKNTGFDSKRFAADHPDVYEQYKTITEYTRTTIKKR